MHDFSGIRAGSESGAQAAGKLACSIKKAFERASFLRFDQIQAELEQEFGKGNVAGLNKVIDQMCEDGELSLQSSPGEGMVYALR